MSEYIWVKNCGLVQEEEIITDALRRISENFLFLAYSTDSFLAGHAVESELKTLKPENLLELRIFSEEQEICYRRSYIGEDFQWRIASENVESSNERKNNSDNYYIVQYQTLDINWDKVKKEGNPVDKYGNRILYTTVGGKYMLPLDENLDSAKIISYIIYDRNGMAKIVDNRLCGFVQKNIMADADNEEK